MSNKWLWSQWKLIRMEVCEVNFFKDAQGRPESNSPLPRPAMASRVPPGEVLTPEPNASCSVCKPPAPNRTHSPKKRLRRPQPVWPWRSLLLMLNRRWWGSGGFRPAGQSATAPGPHAAANRERKESGANGVHGKPQQVGDLPVAELFIFPQHENLPPRKDQVFRGACWIHSTFSTAPPTAFGLFRRRVASQFANARQPPASKATP